LGAFLFLKTAGLENNIFTHLALVMLIGLLGKNTILIVEFAEQRRAEGLDVMGAIFDGCRQRLRPIVMTSLAFVAGLIPLAVASGAGAAANRTIGVAAVGGMVVGTLGGLLLVPGLYLLIRIPRALKIPARLQHSAEEQTETTVAVPADGEKE
jgi:multidrug efflux pump subunit AcrB